MTNLGPGWQPPRPPLEELDPGIRDLVAELWARCLTTTDSGDGVSKDPDPFCVVQMPHVVVDPAHEDHWRVLEEVADAIAEVRPGEDWNIEFTASRSVNRVEIVRTVIAYLPPSQMLEAATTEASKGRA